MICLYLFLILVQIIIYFSSHESSTIGSINIQNSSFWQKIMAPGFSNIRFLSQYMTWTWPLLILPIIRKNKLSILCKLGIATIACIWFYQALMIQGRALYLEFMIVPVLILILYRRNSLPWLKWQLIALSIGAALWYVMYLHLFSGQTRASLAVTEHTERWYIYKACLIAALQHPLLGEPGGQWRSLGSLGKQCFDYPLDVDREQRHHRRSSLCGEQFHPCLP